MKGSGADAQNSSMAYAQLQSVFSIVQTVGALAAGRLLDYFSVKYGFIICFLGSAVGYYLLSISTSMDILYLSKVPMIFQNAYLCAQLAVSQVTSDGPDRVSALGRLTLAYTVGTILGPAIGGYLGASGKQEDYFWGAQLATAGSLLSILLTALFLPNNLAVLSASALSTSPAALSAAAAAAADNAAVSSSFNSTSTSTSTSTSDKPAVAAKEQIPSIGGTFKMVWLLLTTKVVTSVANSMAGNALPLILKNNYKLKEFEIGLIFSSQSVLNGFFAGFLLKPITTRLGGPLEAVQTCLIAMALCNIAQGFWAQGRESNHVETSFTGLYIYMTFAFFLSIFQYILAPSITAKSTEIVDKAKGTLIGLEHSLFAVARIPTPQLAVYLWEISTSTLSYTCAGIFGGTYMLWMSYRYTILKSKTLANTNSSGSGDINSLMHVTDREGVGGLAVEKGNITATEEKKDS